MSVKLLPLDLLQLAKYSTSTPAEITLSKVHSVKLKYPTSGQGMEEEQECRVEI